MTIYSDDFNRTNGDSGSQYENQSASTVGFTIISSNKLQLGDGNNSEESYNGLTTSGDCFAKLSLATFQGANGGACGPMIRAATPTTRTFYVAFAEKNFAQTSELLKRIAGALTSLGTENATTWAAGNTIELRYTGANTLEVYRNGGSPLLTSNDSALTAGRIGFRFGDPTVNSDCQGDDFSGGDFTAILEQTHYRFRADDGTLAAKVY